MSSTSSDNKGALAMAEESQEVKSSQTAQDEDKEAPSFVAQSIKWLLDYSWVIPPACTIIVGGLVNFRLATIISCAWAWVFLGIGFIYTRYVEPSAASSWPKTFDVVNPIAFAFLLPIALIAGEDFCRLWMGVIVLAIFVTITFGSLLIHRPLMLDWMPDDEKDERLKPIYNDVRFYLTLILGVVLVIMFASNFAVAILELQFGTTYVILNFVVPYGTLAASIPFMYRVGPLIWFRSAEKHYGAEWQETLFPQSNTDEIRDESKDSAV